MDTTGTSAAAVSMLLEMTSPLVQDDLLSKHFRQVRMRADSGYYSQALVKICEQREVEFFIVAKQHRNLMNAVREIQDSNCVCWQ